MNAMCAADRCAAFATEGSPYCQGHQQGRLVRRHEEGHCCLACGKLLRERDVVTHESKAGSMRHVTCPPVGKRSLP